MGDPGAPDYGDVVGRTEMRGATRVCVMRTASGVDQILHRTREDAIAQAVAFATEPDQRVAGKRPS
jgi:hypothetical protein